MSKSSPVRSPFLQTSPIRSSQNQQTSPTRPSASKIQEELKADKHLQDLLRRNTNKYQWPSSSPIDVDDLPTFSNPFPSPSRPLPSARVLFASSSSSSSSSSSVKKEKKKQSRLNDFYDPRSSPSRREESFSPPSPPRSPSDFETTSEITFHKPFTSKYKAGNGLPHSLSGLGDPDIDLTIFSSKGIKKRSPKNQADDLDVDKITKAKEPRKKSTGEGTRRRTKKKETTYSDSDDEDHDGQGEGTDHLGYLDQEDESADSMSDFIVADDFVDTVSPSPSLLPFEESPPSPPLRSRRSSSKRPPVSVDPEEEEEDIDALLSHNPLLSSNTTSSSSSRSPSRKRRRVILDDESQEEPKSNASTSAHSSSSRRCSKRKAVQEEEYEDEEDDGNVTEEEEIIEDRGHRRKWMSTQEVEEELEKSGKRRTVLHRKTSLKDSFKVYVQYLASSLIDPDFLEMIGNDEEDDYFEPARAKIEHSITDRTQLLLSSQIWAEEFKQQLETYPHFKSLQLLQAVCDRQCDACRRSNHPAAFRVALSGTPYKPFSLYHSRRSLVLPSLHSLPPSRSSTVFEVESDDPHDDQQNGKKTAPDQVKDFITGTKRVREHDPANRNGAQESVVVVYYLGRNCHHRTFLFHKLLNYKLHLLRQIQHKFDSLKRESAHPLQDVQLIELLLDDSEWIAKLLRSFRSLLDQTDSFATTAKHPDLLLLD